jgi:diguanylate cyclase
VPRPKLPGRVLRRRRADGHLLDAALELAGVAMIACAADGRLTHANRHARALLGAALPALGSYPDTWFHDLKPRTASGVALPLEDLPIVRALAGEVVCGVDVLIALPGGGEMLVEAAARPANDPRGRRRGAVVMLADVTERRRQERRMRSPGWAPWSDEEGPRRIP